MSRCLVDSNVLVYAVDAAEPAKAALAVHTLDRLVRADGCVSTQVIGEFVRVATSRIPSPLTRVEAVRLALEYCVSWTVLPVEPITIVEALRGFERHGLSWWDAQLWATARMNGVSVVVSEDFENGRLIDGVRFMDPFAEGFDPESIGGRM